MTSRPTHCLLLLCALALAPAGAVAQTDEEGGDQQDPEPEVSSQPASSEPVTSPTQASPYERILALSVTAGLDTPVGIVGANVEVSPVRWITIYAGGGVSRSGARIAGGISGQYPVGHGSVGMSVGLAGGPLDWDSLGANDQRVHRYWEFALYLDWALNAEYRWDEGFFGRISLGVESALTNATSCSYIESGTDCTGANLIIPTRGWAGLTVGYALDL